MIKEAKAKIEQRAKERYDKEYSEYQEKMDKRKAKEEQTGKKPRGKTPKPPQEDPKPKDQINLTDEESRIMKTSGGGFDQAYNAQASVEHNSRLIMGFRQLMLRGFEKAKGEWNLICIAYNLKRMYTMRG